MAMATTTAAGMWFPYDPQPIPVTDEYYARVQEVEVSERITFTDRSLADKIDLYAIAICV